MSDILYRAELHNPEQARAVLKQHTLPWVGQQLEAGRQLVAEFRLLDDDITDKQRAYLHAVVLTEIAQGMVIDGRRYPMPVWKEHFRAEINPDPTAGWEACMRADIAELVKCDGVALVWVAMTVSGWGKV